MKRKSSESETDRPATSGVTEIPIQTPAPTSSMAHEKTQQQQSAKRMGKRPGRKPSKIDQRAKLERSRQSARECRARKKLRYQYLEELVSSREKAVFSLREEVEMYMRWSVDLDRGVVPEGLLKLLAQEETMQKGRGGSPHSHSSTPTASPSSSSVPDTEHAASSLQGAQPALAAHFLTEQGRRQQQLTRQPAVNQQLSTITRGCRSFEESLQSSSSSPSSAFAAGSSTAAPSPSLVYRSGSVPNLTASHHYAHHRQYPISHPSSTNTSTSSSTTTTTTTTPPVFPEDSGSSLSSTGFLPGQLSLLGGALMMEADSDTSTPSTTISSTNIPTVVAHHSHSPPSASATKPGPAWTWDHHPRHQQQHHQHHHHSTSQSSQPQSRTYPYTCVSGGVQSSHSLPQQSTALHGSGCVSGGGEAVFCSSKAESPMPNFLMSRSTVGGGVVGGRTVVRKPSAGGLRSISSTSTGGGGTAAPSYQRPRSSSDLARRVTPSMIPSPSISSSSASSSTVSQQNMPATTALFETPATTIATTTAYSGNVVVGGGGVGYPQTVTNSVTTCLANTAILQEAAPMCVGSELSLSASISEPLPHWYSFLDDLENASFSARQGAFSEAGTPGGSSRGGRSGPGTPSSVDSPYSQQQLLQQQQQQQQQQEDGSGDGNIPTIISDLLGQSHSS